MRQSRVSLVGIPWGMGSLKRVSSQCVDANDPTHPNLCSLECVLLRSYVVYVHQFRVSSLGSYMCSPFEGVLSGSHGYPNTCVSIEGALVWVHVENAFTEEGVLSGSYVYVHRLRMSFRVHMGNKGSARSIRVFVYITVGVHIIIHTCMYMQNRK